MPPHRHWVVLWWCQVVVVVAAATSLGSHDDDNDVRPIVAASEGHWNMIHSWIHVDDNNNNTYCHTDHLKNSTMILAFLGPVASERGMTEPGTYRRPSTFGDYRCDLILMNRKNKNNNDTGANSSTTTNNKYNNNNIDTVMIVPCYYSGSGNAANTGAVGGVIWQCAIRLDHHHVQQQQQWLWTHWKLSLVSGTNIATTTYVSGSHGNPAGFFHNVTGTRPVLLSSSNDASQLDDITSHVPLFSKSSSPFITGVLAMDFLNCIDFDQEDGDIPSHHQRHTYRASESLVSTIPSHRPTWRRGRGRAITGAISHLLRDTAAPMVLALTTLSFPHQVFPFVDPHDRLSYDISKLAQWEVVFRYAADVGLPIMLILNDDDDTLFLDYEEQHLYVREMVARFGPYVVAYTVASLEMAEFIRALGGHHPMTASIFWRIPEHTEIVSISENVQSVDGIIYSTDYPSSRNAYEMVKNWKQSNPKTLIFMSAKIPFSATTNQTENIRWIWSTLFAGGAGVLLQPSRPSENETENGVMDFVSQNDAFVRNHRSISTIWEQRFASLSPNTMDCQDMFVSVADDAPCCWSDVGFVHVAIYIPAHITNDLFVRPQFLVDSQYRVEWIDPFTGTVETDVGVTTISGDRNRLGVPPMATKDWIAWLDRARPDV